MRIRATKPEFWRSERMSLLSWEDRFLFKALEHYVDDNGVGKDDVALIACEMFPRDMATNPRETLARVSEGISRIESVGMVWRYTAGNTRLLYVSFFDSSQRIDKPGKGRFPRPDGTMDYKASEIRESVASPPETLAPGTGEQGNRGTGEQGKEILVAQVSAAPTPVEDAPDGATKQGRYIEPDWQPSESTVVWAKTNYSHLDLPAEHQRFVNYWLGESGQKARKRNWDRAFMNWLSNSRGNRNSPTRVGLAPSDARVARVQALKNNNYEETKELLA